jgi:hypothetical protein
MKEKFQEATGGCLMMAALLLVFLWFFVSPSGTNAYGYYNDYKDLPQLSGWMSVAYGWLDWLIEPVKDGKLEGWQLFYAFLGQLSLIIYIAISAWGGGYMIKRADYRHVWPVAAITVIAVWVVYLGCYLSYVFYLV